MKCTTDRPFADRAKAARKLLEIANETEAVQDGHIHIEKINGDVSVSRRRLAAEYGGGLAYAIERGLLWKHEIRHLCEVHSGRCGTVRLDTCQVRPSGDPHTGRLTSQTSPSLRQLKLTCPFCWTIICSMIRLPSPVRVGSCATGPPFSIQRSRNRPSTACDHSKWTWPFGEDKAPYFAALVASSCNVIATAWAASGANMVCGPSMKVRSPSFSE